MRAFSSSGYSHIPTSNMGRWPSIEFDSDDQRPVIIISSGSQYKLFILPICPRTAPEGNSNPAIDAMLLTRGAAGHFPSTLGWRVEVVRCLWCLVVEFRGFEVGIRPVIFWVVSACGGW